MKTYPVNSGPPIDVRISLYDYLIHEFLKSSIRRKSMFKPHLLERVLHTHNILHNEFSTTSSSEEEFVIIVCSFLIPLKTTEITDLFQSIKDLDLRAKDFGNQLYSHEIESKILVQFPKIIIDGKEYILDGKAFEIAAKLIKASKNGDDSKKLYDLIDDADPDKKLRDYFRSQQALTFKNKYLRIDGSKRWRFVYSP